MSVADTKDIKESAEAAKKVHNMNVAALDTIINDK
jgi:hypothetical protein